ncbi:MAG: YihY/virulence factor BrkB family protein [Armatimonadota bacterium]|nr:YihY/virulence factor BrkB family protein [Armatimonadota bacterium]
MQAAIDLVRRGLTGWKTNNGTRIAAALAYTSLFAVAPMLLLAMSAAAQVYGEHDARVQLFDASKRILGSSSAKALTDILAASQTGTGAATIIGTILLVLAASGAFSQLATGLNEILGGQEKEPTGFPAVIRGRIAGVLIVLALALLTVALTVLSAWLAFAARMSTEYLPSSGLLLVVADTLFTIVAVGFSFAMLYRWIPTKGGIEWRSAIVGALIGSVLFALSKILLSLYLRTFDPTSAFGAAGSIVALLLFIYISSLVLLFGAEMAKAFQRPRDSAEATI